MGDTEPAVIYPRIRGFVAEVMWGPNFIPNAQHDVPDGDIQAWLLDDASEADEVRDIEIDIQTKLTEATYYRDNPADPMTGIGTVDPMGVRSMLRHWRKQMTVRFTIHHEVDAGTTFFHNLMQRALFTYHNNALFTMGMIFLDGASTAVPNPDKRQGLVGNWNIQMPTKTQDLRTLQTWSVVCTPANFAKYWIEP